MITIRIGVVSDTHIPMRARFLPPALLEGLQGVDLILHAGDLVDEAVLWELMAIAPVEAVGGNVDPPELRNRLGRFKLLNLGGFNVGLFHGDGAGGSTPLRALSFFSDAHCVVFGHSHRAYNERHGQVLLFNPGSPTDKRGASQPSYGILEIGNGIRGEIIYF